MTARRKQPPPPRKTPCDLCAAGNATKCKLALTQAHCTGPRGGPYTSVEVANRMDYKEGESEQAEGKAYRKVTRL